MTHGLCDRKVCNKLYYKLRLLALSLSFTHTHTHIPYILELYCLHISGLPKLGACCVLSTSRPPLRRLSALSPHALFYVFLCMPVCVSVCVLVLFYCMLSGAATYRFTIEKYTLAFFRQFSQNCTECISLFLFFLLFGPASLLYLQCSVAFIWGFWGVAYISRSVFLSILYGSGPKNASLWELQLI